MPDPLSFTDDPSVGAAQRLDRLLRQTHHLAGPRLKLPEWRADWRELAGFHVPLSDTSEASSRRGFNQHYGSSPLIRGMGLTEISWSPGVIELAASVAAWARGALERIVKLEDERAELTEQLATERRRAAGLAAELTEARTAYTNVKALLVETEAGRETDARAAQERERALSEALRIAEARTTAAEGMAAAWKASADATGEALRVLRIAVKIPEAEAADRGEVSVVRR